MIENLAASEDPADRYPECRNAMRLLEELGDEPGWTVADLKCRLAATCETVSDLATQSQKLLELALACIPKQLANEDQMILARKAMREMNTPQFRQYLAAKLGLV